MKIKSTLLLLLPLMLLASCEATNSNNSSSKDDNNPQTDLIFSEFLKGNKAYDRALEIYNYSSHEVDLGSYSIRIYKGSKEDKYIDIGLNGLLDAHKTYVLAHPKADDTIKAKADSLKDELMIDGTWPLALRHNNSNVDVLGTIGYQNDFGTYCDLVRKKEFLLPKQEYNPYEWVKYNRSETKFLGQVDNVISEKDLLDGPKLTKEDFSKPIIDIENDVGGGGVSKAKLNHMMDGDTTSFSFDTELQHFSTSVRYLGINTPEIQHGNRIQAQPWGYKAKDYNNDILRNAKHFLIQTGYNSSYKETYDRFLGFVWYTNVQNPNPEDYHLLNFEMVKAALAFQSWHGQKELEMYSNGLSYQSYFENAELKVKLAREKIHGEIDPDFNY